tara:strand:+ start:6510 stop:6872 length:363 start_codon:yes stop_codon:yes gene_type:complete
MNNEKRRWVPEIVYEEYEESNLTSGLPFITIPDEKEMPAVLFFLGTTNTGEHEPGSDGEPQPIVEVEVYQFACMKYLEESLSADDYDKVRIALELEPKLEARKKGSKISETMVENISSPK